jgi:hypothetical protein
MQIRVVVNQTPYEFSRMLVKRALSCAAGKVFRLLCSVGNRRPVEYVSFIRYGCECCDERKVDELNSCPDFDCPSKSDTVGEDEISATLKRQRKSQRSDSFTSRLIEFSCKRHPDHRLHAALEPNLVT